MSQELLHPQETVADFIAAESRIAHETQASFPVDSENLRAGSALGATTLKFVFWKHVEENFDQVAPLVEDCDVIALEAMTYFPNREDDLTKEEVEIYNLATEARLAAMAFATGTAVSSEMRAKLKKLKLIPRFSGANLTERQAAWTFKEAGVTNYCESLYAPLIGKQKTFAKLDVGAAEAGHVRGLWQKEKEAHGVFWDSIDYGSWQELRKQYKEWLLAEVDFLATREQTAVGQIQELVVAHPGKKIAILYGEGHHLLTRLIDASNAEGVAMQRVFMKDRAAAMPDFDYVQEHDDIAKNILRAGLNTPVEMDLALLWSLIDLYDDAGKALCVATPEQTKVLLSRIKKIHETSIDRQDPQVVSLVKQRRSHIEQAVNELVAAVGLAAETPYFDLDKRKKTPVTVG